jgi:RHS repeat-associated protein
VQRFVPNPRHTRAWLLVLLATLAPPALAQEGDLDRLLRQVPLAPAHYAPSLGSAAEGLPQVEVRPESGRATLMELDLALEGVTLWRARSGDGAPGGLFGRGWRSLLDTRVAPHGEGLVLVRPQGTTLFVPLHDDVLVSVSGQVELLRRTTTGFELATAGGRLLRFDAAGLLTAIEPGVIVRRSAERLRLETHEGRLAAELTLTDGRVTALHAAGGAEQRYRYDAQGRLQVVSGQLTRTYAHDAEGWITEVSTPAGALSLTRDGERLRALTRPGWTQTYDHTRGTAVETPRGTWRYVLAEAGWHVETPAGSERVWLDARGVPQEVQAAGGAREPYRRARDRDPWPQRLPGGDVERVHDAAGRLTAVQGPGPRETFALDEAGRVTSRTTVDGRTARYAYDDAGRVTCEVAPEGTTRWAWNDAGRLAAVTTPAGRRWSLAWEAGRLVGEDGPMGPVAWTRDEAGRPLQREDASGRRIQYHYDESGRPDAVRVGDQTLRLRYDEGGRMVAWSDGARTVAQRPDDQGRWTEVRADGARLRYRDGQRTSEVATAWGIRRWHRDESGRVVRLESPAGEFLFTYDAHGLRTGLRYPNGVEVELERDDLGRVASLAALDPAGDALLRVSSRWDEHHQRQQRQTTTPAGVRTERYRHDATGRLAGWTDQASDEAAWDWRCAYGGDGDRTQETRGGQETTSEYDDRGRLLARGAARFRYDEAGRLLERRHAGGVDRFAYDGFGRLATAQRAGGPLVSYAWDPLGRLAERRVGEASIRYVWEGQRLLAERGPGERERVYVYGPDLDEPLAVRDGDTWTYLVSDELHHLLLRVDAEGRPLEHVALSPWGEVLHGDPSRPIFFAGRIWDPSARIYPMRARCFDPELGRFLTPDPSGLRGGVNAYTYCRARPLDRIDPLGAWDWVPDWAARGAAWVEQTALPAVVDAGDFLRLYGEVVWEDVKSGAARDRIFGTVDAYASFLTLGLVDPGLSRLAGDPEQAQVGRFYGEAAGWAFAIVSGRELIKAGALGLVRGARALPSTIPRLPGLLRSGGQRLPGALASLPGKGKAWAVALPGAAWAGSKLLWANKAALGQSLADFLRAQGSQAWNVTGRPFVSLYEAVALKGRQATAWLKAKRAPSVTRGSAKAGHGGASGTTAASEGGSTAANTGAVNPSGATGSAGSGASSGDDATTGIRDVIEGRTRTGRARRTGPNGFASVHGAPPAWLERRFASTVAAVRQGKAGPAANADDVKLFLDETYEHVNEVNALVKAMGGKPRPIPAVLDDATALRGIHDFGEAASIRQVEALIADLRRNPIVVDGVPLEVPAWLARLPGEARAAGKATIDIGKANPHVAAGLSGAGKPDPFALRLHQLSPHHAAVKGGQASEEVLIETVADMVHAMRQSRGYSPQPLSLETIRENLYGMVGRGDLPGEAIPIIERALEALPKLERAGTINPYHLLASGDDVRAATNAGAGTGTGGAATAAANASNVRKQVGRLLGELRKHQSSTGSRRGLELLEEAHDLFQTVARAGNQTDQAILAGLRYEYQLMRVRLGEGSLAGYERLLGTLHAGLDSSVRYHVTHVSNLPGILRNGLRSSDGYGVYFNNPLTRETAQLGRGGAVIRVKPEFEHLYRFERSASSESLHGVVALDSAGAPVQVIPAQHLEAVPLPMPKR